MFTFTLHDSNLHYNCPSRAFHTENWPQHLLTSGKFCCGVSDLCIMWKYYIARQRRKYHQHACMYIYIHNSTLLLHFHNRATRNYNCSPITLLCEVWGERTITLIILTDWFCMRWHPPCQTVVSIYGQSDCRTPKCLFKSDEIPVTHTEELTFTRDL